MNPSNSSAVILAAGKGKRMGGDLPKVLQPIAGRAMILHVLDTVATAGIQNPVVVTGYQGEMVRDCIRQNHKQPVRFAQQAEQLGTGHAVLCAREHFANSGEKVFILSGDVPLLRAQTLVRMGRQFDGNPEVVLSLLSMELADGGRYGRILRHGDALLGVREYADATPAERSLREVNAGTYLVRAGDLFQTLQAIGNNNNSGEYYLPDIIELFHRANRPMLVYRLDDTDEALGANTPEELAVLEAIYKKREN